MSCFLVIIRVFFIHLRNGANSLWTVLFAITCLISFSPELEILFYSCLRDSITSNRYKTTLKRHNTFLWTKLVTVFLITQQKNFYGGNFNFLQLPGLRNFRTIWRYYIDKLQPFRLVNRNLLQFATYSIILGPFRIKHESIDLC